MATQTSVDDVEMSTTTTTMTTTTTTASPSPSTDWTTSTYINVSLHQHIVNRLVEQINSTLQKNSGERESRFFDANVTSPSASFEKGVFQWDAYRVNTVAYIGLALLCVVLLGVVSAFYAK